MSCAALLEVDERASVLFAMLDEVASVLRRWPCAHPVEVLVELPVATVGSDEFRMFVGSALHPGDVRVFCVYLFNFHFARVLKCE